MASAIANLCTHRCHSFSAGLLTRESLNTRAFPSLTPKQQGQWLTFRVSSPLTAPAKRAGFSPASLLGPEGAAKEL
jgi:hypothetical protein